jgi:hypothetical protein
MRERRGSEVPIAEHEQYIAGLRVKLDDDPNVAEDERR